MAFSDYLVSIYLLPSPQTVEKMSSSSVNALLFSLPFFIPVLMAVSIDGGTVCSRQDGGAAGLGVPLGDAVGHGQARLSPRSQVQAAQAHVRTDHCPLSGFFRFSPYTRNLRSLYCLLRGTREPFVKPLLCQMLVNRSHTDMRCLRWWSTTVSGMLLRAARCP